MMNDPLVLLLGTWADDLTPAGILLRIGLAVGLSGIIGWERARKRHSAGLRTFILITLGAAVVMMLDLGLEQNHQEQNPYQFHYQNLEYKGMWFHSRNDSMNPL